jgi:hypothetical protein
MLNLPMKAEVFCSDGPAGRLTHVVGKPDNHEITHLVVKSYLPPFREYLVPVNEIEGTTNGRIDLKCTRAYVNRMEPFEYEEFIQAHLPAYLIASDVLDIPATPYSTQTLDTFVPVKHQNIPPEESTLRRGARVETTDSYVGQVGELLIDPSSMQVTHLTVLIGHLFEERKINIPISKIDSIEKKQST